VELGKHGRNRTNVWSYAGANAFSKTRDRDLAMHPTVKPVELVADAILDASNSGDIVLDAFGGSGTTLVAAAQTGRRGRAIEIDPHYVDTIIKRLEKTTGKKATLGKSCDTFEDMKAFR
jgi:DNA modification methylase